MPAQGVLCLAHTHQAPPCPRPHVHTLSHTPVPSHTCARPPARGRGKGACLFLAGHARARSRVTLFGLHLQDGSEQLLRGDGQEADLGVGVQAVQVGALGGQVLVNVLVVALPRGPRLRVGLSPTARWSLPSSPPPPSPCSPGWGGSGSRGPAGPRPPASRPGCTPPGRSCTAGGPSRP